jgi:two-component system, NtrC family, sensor kinase
MWPRWSLRAKIAAVTVGAVLPIVAATTTLTVRLSRSTLEDDMRSSGLAMARELARSAASEPGPGGDAALRQEIDGLVGRGSLIRDAVVYAVRPHGLAARAWGGLPPRPGPEEEIVGRENQEVVAQRVRDGTRSLRVAVPIRADGRSVGVVALGLPLDRTEALSRLAAHQAIGLGAVAVILLIGSLSALLNRALTGPIRRLLQVMQRAEGGDLAARAPEDREDEVGQVARGLNRMLRRVSSFQDEMAGRIAEATAELRATNQRLFAAQIQVARNERLAAAGEMAAAMAHDVGTPLTGVSGHLQLLTEEVADPAVRDRLAKIQGQVDRAVTAARRFLDAARPAPSRVAVDLGVLLEDLLLLTSPEAQRKGIVVTRLFAASLPPITGDPNQLQELLLNLITNALDAMGAGGTLTVTAEPTAVDDGERAVRIIVADTGPGIPLEVLSRAFEPFFTTRGSSGGTGLGLPIARRIAREHGGSIRLESEPGRGARAIVELPVLSGEGA